MKLTNEQLEALARIFNIGDYSHLPDWYGIPGIKFLYHNCWSDPELIYKGRKINSREIEDIMWEYYVEETGREDYGEFDRYMLDNKDEVYGLLEEYIENIA